MHARHRSPGNGYRSNSYNSDYRSFNRGLGLGFSPKSQQSFTAGASAAGGGGGGGDIFIEAGRLAAQYLVSKGLLPPNSLPLSLPLPPKNLHFQDFDTTPSRRPRRRPNSFRNYASDYINTNTKERSTSLSDKLRISPDTLTDDGDSISAHLKPVQPELTPKIDDEKQHNHPIKDDVIAPKTDATEIDNNASNDDKLGPTLDLPLEECPMDVDDSSSSIDVLKLCHFAKVPTRTRSAITSRGSKVDPFPIAEEENKPPFIEQANVIAVEGSSSGVLVSNRTPNSICIESEVEASQGPPGFGRSTSLVRERGEKRAIEYSDSEPANKKPKEWLSTITSVTSEKQTTSPCGEVNVSVPQDISASLSMFPIAGAEPCIEYVEEDKQPFSNSFKICDLNLMEASDMNENHDTTPLLMFPSILNPKKEASPVDIDLSMSNEYDVPDEYRKHISTVKEVEVIDLENDSIQEEGLNGTERKTETEFTNLEGFPNHSQDTNELPDAQDGYVLMISELLGNDDIANCSSVPPDINSLHNEMSLHNGEGILGDDDPIYMSLGEIPISFLRGWEPPNQEYE